MKTDDIIEAFTKLTPEELVDVTSRLARLYAEKAESIFDQDPEKNAPLAQPYADVSDAMSDASLAWTPDDDVMPVDEEPVVANTKPRTPKLSEVTRKSWGGR